MNTRMLSEPEAWRVVAEIIDSRRERFICYAIDRAGVSADVAYSMRKRLRDYGVDSSNTIWGLALADEALTEATPYSMAHDIRVLAALWFALEAEEVVS